MTTFPSNLRAAARLLGDEGARRRSGPSPQNRNPLLDVSLAHAARAQVLWRNARAPELPTHLRQRHAAPR
jgi:hypothetical protein